MHSKLNAYINKAHPNLYELTKKKIDINSVNKLEYQRLNGVSAPKEKKKNIYRTRYKNQEFTRII